ncbi:MAG TPA: lactate utilization protein C [Burkholderiales bacterium]|nr:lactate utilization protein C [Burkholderiales bacterium]
MSGRDNILARVRDALGRSGPLDAVRSGSMRIKLREHPRGPQPTMAWQPLERFKERCVVLSSTIDEVAQDADVPAAVSRYLAERDLPRWAVCWPRLEALGWQEAGLRVEARPPNGEDKVGITGCFCAIAETGTLMLLSGADTYPATSLLPETHIALVPVSRIVHSMEDGWDLLRKERGELPRQVAFVSGPSRTADIEMTLVLGIHGPYRVHIILVGR